MNRAERKIVFELGPLLLFVVAVFAFYQFSIQKNADQIAPVITAGIAALAACVALYSIFAQRDIARRRTSIDFFLKTEMDQQAIDCYKKFKSRTFQQYETWAQRPDFATGKDYHDVRAFLNICELIAVGILHKAFSDLVSYAYWGDVLPDALARAKPLINRIRETKGEGTKHTYCDLESLCKKWELSPP
jgi:hypothetical protein